jgi:hypothetical protein
MTPARIASHEQVIRGEWITKEGKVQGDETCLRIEALIADHLKPLGRDASGWDHLYLDSDDGRYWELTYPESELHGGGPPCLICIPEKEARAKYGQAFEGEC